jgi:hypothetical protein
MWLQPVAPGVQPEEFLEWMLEKKLRRSPR